MPQSKERKAELGPKRLYELDAEWRAELLAMKARRAIERAYGLPDAALPLRQREPAKRSKEEWGREVGPDLARRGRAVRALVPPELRYSEPVLVYVRPHQMEWLKARAAELPAPAGKGNRRLRVSEMVRRLIEVAMEAEKR